MEMAFGGRSYRLNRAGVTCVSFVEYRTGGGSTSRAKSQISSRKSRSEIKERLDVVCGDTSPSLVTVKNWFNEFQRGRTLVSNEPRPGAPKIATTENNVTKIHDLVLADHRLKVSEIAEIVSISKDHVAHILHEILGIRKLSARWVPRLLTPDNKRNLVTTSEQCLALFKRNPKEFLRRYGTFGETWIHWYIPETKEQSKQWTLPAPPRDARPGDSIEIGL
ncbi:mariner transposase [Trichonephila clavata]|uniref:Mariner transposase n=1 Tax=Trichonephila clavata TaxID=2740835 RepID=A0A8X6HNA4_TRICU|nr:mariner transposase [Trichonephila clavata]